METTTILTTAQAAREMGLSYWQFYRRCVPKLTPIRLFGSTGPILFNRQSVLDLKREFEIEKESANG